jgi:hypothetical protein
MVALNKEKGHHFTLKLNKLQRLACLGITYTIGPSNKYIFRVGVGNILILLTV